MVVVCLSEIVRGGIGGAGPRAAVPFGCGFFPFFAFASAPSMNRWQLLEAEGGAPLFWRRPALPLFLLRADVDKLWRSIQSRGMGERSEASELRDPGCGSSNSSFSILSGHCDLALTFHPLRALPPSPHALPALQLSHNEVLRFHRPRPCPLRGLRAGKKGQIGVFVFSHLSFFSKHASRRADIGRLRNRKRLSTYTSLAPCSFVLVDFPCSFFLPAVLPLLLGAFCFLRQP